VCDQVPVLIQTDRNHGLNATDPLCGVVGANAEIKIVLKRDTDEICDGILGLFSQFLGAFGLWVSGWLGRVSGANYHAKQNCPKEAQNWSYTASVHRFVFHSGYVPLC
jgi:hypothetical protein